MFTVIKLCTRHKTKGGPNSASIAKFMYKMQFCVGPLSKIYANFTILLQTTKSKLAGEDSPLPPSRFAGIQLWRQIRAPGVVWNINQ